MPIRTLLAIFFIAINPIGTGAWGQNIYKCGNAYSQQPCPGGTLVDASDARTGEQKKASDLASQRNAKAANAQEQARLKKDKADLQAVAPAVKPTKPQAAAVSQAKDSRPEQQTAKKPKLSSPDEFKAQVPGEPGAKDKKKTAKKSAAAE
jgi:hypothetical protein